MGDQRHAPAPLPPGKTRYPLYRRLGGPHGRFGGCGKSRPSLGFDSRTVQPVASRYTNCAIPVNMRRNKYYIFWVWMCSLMYPALNAYVSYYTAICGLSGGTIFSHIISQPAGFSKEQSYWIPFFYQQMHLLLNIQNVKIYIKISYIRSYMFRPNCCTVHFDIAKIIFTNKCTFY